MLCSFEMFPLFQWHACELAELSACIAKCMTTINMNYIFYIYKTKKPCRLLENNAFFNGLGCFSINSLCSAKFSDCDSKCKKK